MADVTENRANIEAMCLSGGSEGTVCKAGTVLAAAGFVIVVGNEIYQRLVSRGVIDNHQVFGYLLDLFAIRGSVHR